MGRYDKQPLPALDLLDTILLKCDSITTNDKTNFYFFEQTSNISSHHYVRIEAIDSALIKLVKEGYMTSAPYSIKGLLNTTIETFSYNITWEGRYFIEIGGYRGRLSREAKEKDRIKKLEERNRKSNEDMVYLTRILVIATVISSAYYVLEILKWIYSLSCSLDY